MVAFIWSVVLVNCMRFGLYALLRLAEPRSGSGGGFGGEIGFELAFKGSNIGFNWVQIGFFWL
jgi:hypothetical protein